MIWLYNILITFLAPLWVPLVWWKARRRKEKPNWKERYGNLVTKFDREKPIVWVHAVSVGEVVAALPVLREIRALDPSAQILLTVTTSTGHQTARDRALAQNLVDQVAYFPIDVARFMWQATWKVRANVVAVFETELWLNFLYFSKDIGATTLLVNGRISDHSFRRSKWIAFYYETVLEYLDRALMQSQADADRIRALGAKTADVVGNTKFDEQVSEDPSRRELWRAQVEARPDDLVIVVGSTRGEMEESFVLEALGGLDHSRVCVLHAPRHVEGADKLRTRAALQFDTVAQRSKKETARYLVLDTYGELADAYSAADIAIVGGGFDQLGGQNLIQPLAYGVPVIHGPHMMNFRDTARMAQEAGAAHVVSTPAELRALVQRWIDNPEERRSKGAKGKELVHQNQGASRRYATAIVEAAKASLRERENTKKPKR